MQADAAGENTPAGLRSVRIYPTLWQALAIAAIPIAVELCAVAAPAFPVPRWLAAPEPIAGMITLLAGAAFIALVPVYPVSVIVAAILVPLSPRRSRHRSTLIRVSAALLVGTLGMVFFMPAVNIMRMWGMRTAARRAKPLVAALETYRAERGEYPSSLADLVPDYLNRVPGTGMVAYQHFSYNRAARVPGQSRTRTGVPPAYDLFVGCPLLLLGLDTFHYWPSQDYPEEMWGGVVERIDGWAYVHE